MGLCKHCESSCIGDECESCRKCPLPKVGSDRWGWLEIAESIHEAKAAFVIVTSKRTRHSIIRQGGGLVEVDGVNSATAKRIAELLVRQDWRKNNK